MTDPVGFDEARAFLTAEAERVALVQSALVEDGCLIEPDAKQMRRVAVCEALLRLIDQYQASRSGRGIGVISQDSLLGFGS